ncbi:hypothetical protein BpHYR1_048829 [Brachionus plicatilis]|uniref:Uncharacterized protein n=1 Tax=Brachionus plicatilis TaxID=10195 RepID=A0A3M7PPX9_BRAPC|nr:hypothetical protein BpHYR1_048829 [Brachionus plicatilis]
MGINNTHIQEKRLATWRSNYALKSEIEIEGEDLDQKIKIQLFRTYIRPTIETKKLQTLEGIIIKRMIGVKKRTHTTNSLYALDIEPSSFVKRLLQNDYTTGLLQSIENKEFDENNFKNKFLNGIKGILKTQDNFRKCKTNKLNCLFSLFQFYWKST